VEIWQKATSPSLRCCQELLHGKKQADEKSAHKKKSTGNPSHAPPANASPSATDSLSPSPLLLPHLSKKTHLQTQWLDDPSACAKTCKLERKKKEEDDKRQKAVGASVEVKQFAEVIDATQFPTLVAKNICITSDKDIKLVMPELAKLSKQVKQVDLLEVLQFTDAATSLVEVPCSVKWSGFKQQVQRLRWAERVLKCVRQHKKRCIS
jgi:hypothetical protein